jgi:hypothetical protein
VTGKERVRTAMEGGHTDMPPFSLYVSWPEYGWRLLGRPVWEVVLGQTDGIEAWDRVLSRHPTDFAPGPVTAVGSGWLQGKKLERQDRESAYFRCQETGRRWRFSLASHVLLEVDDVGWTIDHPRHPGDSRATAEPPQTTAEAEAWFGRHHEGSTGAPPGPPEEDRAVRQWGDRYFMVTCTVAPFVAVAYTFGFEPSLVLLAERPRVFARLAELYLERFRAHYEWAARAGYDGGHMVDSWASADIISPALYRDWVAPLHRESARMIQSTGLKADLYSPGYCMPLLEHMRRQGWDAIRIDDRCRGGEQDIGVARRALGPDQCLFGNLSSYSLLGGDWNEIVARVRYQHEAAGRDGRLIVSNGSGICDQTDPDIIDRWIACARDLSAAGMGGRQTQAEDL